MIFNLFLNDLSTRLANTDLGQGTKINMLCYADDLAILAESAEGLQFLLNAVSEWCDLYQVTVNADKTKVLHFRIPSVDSSNHSCKLG